MQSTTPYLSVIAPVYNEQKRLGGLATITDYLKQQNYGSELVVVNDGSTDDTLDRLHDLQKTLDFRIVSYTPNRGKGRAIQQGMLAAKGRFRLFTDVDLSTPITEFDKFIPHLNDFPVVIASRKREGASVVVHQARLRENLGKGFTWLSQVMLQLPLSDFTCGFKCFSASAAEAIFPRLTIDRWGFDSEQLYIARRLGFAIKEVPVTWINDPQTKVRLPHDIIRSLADLLTIRLNSVRRKYD